MSTSIPDKQAISNIWAAVKDRSIPLKPLTKAEYDVLDETQRDAEIAYLVQTSNSINLIYKGLSISESGSVQFSDTPIGTVISFMGTSVPDNYLICDGAVYNVADYSDLADFFAEQFGSKNYFGGNGTTTFAVPDMRNLFLRGYHGSSSEQLSDEIGEKQEATEHRSIIPGLNSTDSTYMWANFNFNASKSDFDNVINSDTQSRHIGAHGYGYIAATSSSSSNLVDTYTSRPVNMAVLYCIKATESISDQGGLVTIEQVQEIVNSAISGIDDGVPTGAVVSFMALSAPNGYLICDGSIYNISAHSKLASYIKSQFGSSNYFGGNGTTTFAVPDMRNLFLRGYHGSATEQLSWNVGVKQEATISPSIVSGNLNSAHNMILGSVGDSTRINKVEFPDSIIYTGSKLSRFIDNSPIDTDNNSGNVSFYTSRPVNMAVLFCIKE